MALAAACFVVGIVPGPGVASILGFAFSSGRRTALAGVAGMAVGNTVAMPVSLLRAGAILAISARAFTALKWVGTAYLIATGTGAIARSKRETDMAAPPRRAVSPRAAFMTNIANGTFHPKTILFFVGIAATSDTLYALAASRASGRLRSPRAARDAACRRRRRDRCRGGEGDAATLRLGAGRTIRTSRPGVL